MTTLSAAKQYAIANARLLGTIKECLARVIEPTITGWFATHQPRADADDVQECSRDYASALASWWIARLDEELELNVVLPLDRNALPNIQNDELLRESLEPFGDMLDMQTVARSFGELMKHLIKETVSHAELPLNIRLSRQEDGTCRASRTI